MTRNLPNDSNCRKGAGAAPELTPCEREVLHRVALGHCTAKIADELCVSIRTVDAHRRNLGQKLGTSNVADLTRHAARLGLIDPKK